MPKERTEVISLPGPRGKGFGRMGWWITAFTLLLIAEKPRHGYEIATELKRIGFPIFGVAQMGVIYRTLSDLEAGGFVISSWDTSTSPPRKVYRITPLGFEYLSEMAFEVKTYKDMMDTFIERFSNIGGESDERGDNERDS